jgi:hypothetical protein
MGMPGATLGDMGMWPAREPHPGQQLGNSPALGGSLFAAKNGYKMESGHGWETFRGPVRLSLLAAKKKNCVRRLSGRCTTTQRWRAPCVAARRPPAGEQGCLVSDTSCGVGVADCGLDQTAPTSLISFLPASPETESLIAREGTDPFSTSPGVCCRPCRRAKRGCLPTSPRHSGFSFTSTSQFRTT